MDKLAPKEERYARRFLSFEERAVALLRGEPVELTVEDEKRIPFVQMADEALRQNIGNVHAALKTMRKMLKEAAFNDDGLPAYSSPKYRDGYNSALSYLNIARQIYLTDEVADYKAGRGYSAEYCFDMHQHYRQMCDDTRIDERVRIEYGRLSQKWFEYYAKTKGYLTPPSTKNLPPMTYNHVQVIVSNNPDDIDKDKIISIDHAQTEREADNEE